MMQRDMVLRDVVRRDVMWRGLTPEIDTARLMRRDWNTDIIQL